MRDNILVYENDKISENIDRDKLIITNSNPKFFYKDGVRNKFTYVYAPSYPEIEEAYEKAGKKAYRDGANDTKPKPEPEVETSTQTDSQEPVSDSEQEDEPKHWSELSWPQMRSKASNFTDESINSKDKAMEVLQLAEEEGKI